MKKYYLGIDVSKNDLTYCLAKDQNETVMTGEIDNDSKTISTFLKNVLKKNNISKEQLVVGAEYTGIYSNLLASVCDGGLQALAGGPRQDEERILRKAGEDGQA